MAKYLGTALQDEISEELERVAEESATSTFALKGAFVTSEVSIRHSRCPEVGAFRQR